jgi:hypothetical protein
MRSRHALTSRQRVITEDPIVNLIVVYNGDCPKPVFGEARQPKSMRKAHGFTGVDKSGMVIERNHPALT